MHLLPTSGTRCLLFFCIVVILCMLSFPCSSAPAASFPARNNMHVVLIALDGIREDDIVTLANQYSEQLSLSGFYTKWLGKNQGCRINNKQALSLPAYANVLTGRLDTQVTSNYFHRKLRYPTLLQIYSNSQAFTSWTPLTTILGITKETGRVIVYQSEQDANTLPNTDEYVTTLFLEQYNSSQLTFVHYTDADDLAHARNVILYRKAIRTELKQVEIIVSYVVQKVGKDNSFFILFSDHSRGTGSEWHSHGAKIPSSFSMWIWLISPFPIHFNIPICDHIAIHGIIKSLIPVAE